MCVAARGRHQQKIVAQLFRGFLDTQQKGCVEVGLGRREGGLVGEYAQDAIEALDHPPGHRIGDVSGFANDAIDPIPGFSRNAAVGPRDPIEDQGNRGLADTGKASDIALCKPFRKRQGFLRKPLMRIS